MFSDFLQTLPDSYQIIATDASKSAHITSIAACSETSHLVYRVHNINSVFTAEALAICLALDELVSHSIPLLILTDSLSVITALVHLSLSSPKVIIWLFNKLQSTNHLVPSIKIVWVPGHRGIPLNEKADYLAKNVSELDTLIDWISPEDIIFQNKKEISLITERQYHNSKYKTSHKNLPSIKTTHTWFQNRREDVLCSRFLCRMFITRSILFRFRLSDSSLCNRCQVPDTLDHIIFSCSKYRQQRHYCFANFPSTSTCLSNLNNFTDEFCTSPAFRSATIKFFKLVGCS